MEILVERHKDPQNSLTVFLLAFFSLGIVSAFLLIVLASFFAMIVFFYFFKP